MEWQPIETAPKDGTEIDLWVVNRSGNGWRVANAKWSDSYGTDEWVGGKMVAAAGWLQVFDTYNREFGFIDRRDPPWIVPTHWMPLPAPPAIVD